MSETKKFDVERLIEQLEKVDRVIKWVKAIVYKDIKLKKLKQGIDTDVYDEDRLLAKKAQLMEQTEMHQYLPLSEMKMRLMILDDLLTEHRNIAFGKKNSDEKRLESATLCEEYNTEHKQVTQKYQEAVMQIEPDFPPQLRGIYAKVAEGTNIATARDALRTFGKMQNGKMSLNQAANHGLDYEERRGAPTGMFDFMLEGTRMRNGKVSKKYKKLQK